MANTPDPVEIAMSRIDTGAPSDSPAALLLSKLGRLIDLKIAGEQTSVVLRLLTAFVGIAVATGVGAFVINASRASGLVIEAFSVPPDMARNGVTGGVIASQLLDRLVRLDSQVDSIRAPSTYDNDWRGQIKVEIPQIGISLGELNRYLRVWLGNEKRVTGELYRSKGVQLLTVRTGSTPADTFAGAEGDLDALLNRAAEKLYSHTQPYRYGGYLRARDRHAESLAVYQAMAEGTDETERPWGLIGVGTNRWLMIGDRAAIEYFVRASTLDPGNALALFNRAGLDRRIGRSQAYVDHLDRGIRAAETGGGGLREDGLAAYLTPLRADELLGRGDPAGALVLYQQAGKRAGIIDRVHYRHSRSLIELHRPMAALALLRDTPPQANSDHWVNVVNHLEVVLQGAAERGDWTGAVQAVDRFAAAMSGSQRGQTEMQRVMHWRALALARTGRLAEAEQLIAASARDCYPCLIVRGWIAELKGEPRAADRWFAEAVAQGPNLPFADTQWGLALAARKDGDAASVHSNGRPKSPRATPIR